MTNYFGRCETKFSLIKYMYNSFDLNLLACSLYEPCISLSKYPPAPPKIISLGVGYKRKRITGNVTIIHRDIFNFFIYKNSYINS